MNISGPESTFLGLPLSAEQEAEIRHYIHQRARRGLRPDLEELRSMLHDMLEPPLAESTMDPVEALEFHVDAEQAANLVDESCDPIEAYEERISVREGAAMKHPGH